MKLKKAATGMKCPLFPVVLPEGIRLKSCYRILYEAIEEMLIAIMKHPE